MRWAKMLLLRWIFGTKNPPTIRIGYYDVVEEKYIFIYSDKEGMRRFMEMNDLFPKGVVPINYEI